MISTKNEHGETVTVIGSVADGRGGRCDVTIVEFVAEGVACFTVRCVNAAGTARLTGIADARRFSTQVKRCKAAYAHVSNAAEWSV